MQTIIRSWYKRWWIILLFVIATFTAIFLVTFSFYVYDLMKQIDSNQASGLSLIQELKKQEPYKNTENLGSYWLGSENPKLTIVEFADYNCPLCASSYGKIREISLKYKDEVKIIFRDFPVISESSVELAMAGRCAGEQNLFWPMHDKLFQNQVHHSLLPFL